MTQFGTSFSCWSGLGSSWLIKCLQGVQTTSKSLLLHHHAWELIQGVRVSLSNKSLCVITKYLYLSVQRKKFFQRMHVWKLCCPSTQAMLFQSFFPTVMSLNIKFIYLFFQFLWPRGEFAGTSTPVKIVALCKHTPEFSAFLEVVTLFYSQLVECIWLATPGALNSCESTKDVLSF